MSALAEASLFARRIAPKGARSWSRALPQLEVRKNGFDEFLQCFHTCLLVIITVKNIPC